MSDLVARVLRCLMVAAGCILFCVPKALAVSLNVALKSQRSVYMGYSNHDVRALSPNGKVEVTITGKKDSLGAWVTVKQLPEGGSIRVWPVERNVDVLWKPNSSAFALTDNRYANRSYVLIVGTKFHMSGKCLGVRRFDLTPLVKRALMKRVRMYYRRRFGISNAGEPYSLYVKAVRWVGNERLLIGVFAITSLPLHKLGAAKGVKAWERGYLVDVSRMTIMRVVSERTMRARYGVHFSRLIQGS